MEADADFYLTLGVRPDADAAAIRAAYRHLMRRYHPDVNASEDAAAKATSINEAYACLGDEDRRAAYDHARKPKPKPASRPFAAAARAARPMRAQHAHFYQQRTFAAELEPDPPPTRWKVASLTLALLVTLVTFTLTSATPPAPPPPPPTVTFVGQAPLPAAEQPAVVVTSGE